MSLTTVGLALLLEATFPVPSQDTCEAGLSYGGSTMWPTGEGSASSAASAVPPSAPFAKLLTGTFEIVMVTTESVDRAQVSRWELWVTTTDPTATSLCLGRPCRDSLTRHPLVGLKRPSTPPVDTTRLKHLRFFHTPDEVMFRLDLRTGHLSWVLIPEALDVGVFFDVAEVDESGFRGRWEDGGLGAYLLERDGVAVFERPRGYYCAYKTGV